MAASAESEYTRTGLHVRPVRLFVGSWDLGESEERSFRVARTVEVAPLAEGEEVDEDEVEPEWYDERWHDVAGDWMRASCDIATDALCVISLHATIKPGKGDAARRAANLKLRMFELERFFPSTTHRLLAQRFASDSTMAIGVWAARTLVDTWSKSGTFRKLKKTLKLKAKRGAAGMTFEETFVLFKQLWATMRSSLERFSLRPTTCIRQLLHHRNLRVSDSHTDALRASFVPLLYSWCTLLRCRSSEHCITALR